MSVFTTPIFIVSPVLLEDLIFGPHAIQQLQQSTADAVWDYLQVTDMKNIWVDSSAECCSINLLVWEAIRKSYCVFFVGCLDLTPVNSARVLPNNFEAEFLTGENPAMLVKGVCPCTSSHSFRVFKSLQL